MRKSLIVLAAALVAVGVAAAAVLAPRMTVPTPPPAASLYDFTMKNIDGKDQPLKEYKGKVILVVNVASKCGLTPQYAALQKLYAEYKDQGLVILGFPANDFMGQEPGTEEDIKAFCSSKYNVTFPMFSKITVVGKEMNPLYAWLINQSGDRKPIEWNFAKFLVHRNGTKVERFSSRSKPDSAEMIAAIKSALEAQP